MIAKALLWVADRLGYAYGRVLRAVRGPITREEAERRAAEIAARAERNGR